MQEGALSWARPTAPKWTGLGCEPGSAAPRALDCGRHCLSVPELVKALNTGWPQAYTSSPTIPTPKKL